MCFGQRTGVVLRAGDGLLRLVLAVAVGSGGVLREELHARELGFRDRGICLAVSIHNLRTRYKRMGEDDNDNDKDEQGSIHFVCEQATPGHRLPEPIGGVTQRKPSSWLVLLAEVEVDWLSRRGILDVTLSGPMAGKGRDSQLKRASKGEYEEEGEDEEGGGRRIIISV